MEEEGGRGGERKIREDELGGRVRETGVVPWGEGSVRGLGERDERRVCLPRTQPPGACGGGRLRGGRHGGGESKNKNLKNGNHERMV